MVPDYYQVLGVDQSADLNALRKAFSQRARECHPDRGGSHEAMLRVNEAWEVLSNPEKRRNYDAARSNSSDRTAQEKAAEDSRAARQRDEQYPKQWADFEILLSQIAKDFASADYGQTRSAAGVPAFPTISNSNSGCIFIVVGGLLGVLFLILVHEPAQDFFSERHIHLQGRFLLVLLLAPICGGAWLGAMLHKLIRETITKSDREPPRNPQGSQVPNESQKQNATDASFRVVITCEKCGQKLRVPGMQGELLVTCRACSHSFPFLGFAPPSERVIHLARDPLLKADAIRIYSEETGCALSKATEAIEAWIHWTDERQQASSPPPEDSRSDESDVSKQGRKAPGSEPSPTEKRTFAYWLGYSVGWMILIAVLVYFGSIIFRWLTS